MKILGNYDAVETQEFIVPLVPPKRKGPRQKSPDKPLANKSRKVRVLRYAQKDRTLIFWMLYKLRISLMLLKLTCMET